MFYNEEIGDKLRFGDVVKGYLSAIPKISMPFGNASIDFHMPQYSVVLEPCCEIGGGTIILSPLEKIGTQFFDIPHLSKNRTLLNIKGMAKDFFHPMMWNQLDNGKKTEALVATQDYGWKSFFVYEGNPLFPEYTIDRKEIFNEIIDTVTNLPKFETIKEPTKFQTRDRIINFKAIYQVSCNRILKPEKPSDPNILGSIVLQLSMETRNQLREKIANYFGNNPS
jgi:hypothetical protein